MRTVISTLVQNVAGVLSHVAGLLAARGYNVDSLTVGKTDNPEFSRMTVVLGVDEDIATQVEAQLSKLVTVVETQNLSKVERVERELALIRVSATQDNWGEINNLTQIFRARIVDVGEKAVLIEITGEESKLNAFIDVLRPYGKLDVARSGCISMARNPRPRSVFDK